MASQRAGNEGFAFSGDNDAALAKGPAMDLVFSAPPSPASPLRAAIRGHARLDETAADAEILAAADIAPDARDRIAERARRLVAAVRRERHGKGGIDAFLHEYALSSQEGVALLCLAEALLRIPDAETVDRLIRDKLGEADWARHLGHSDSVFVNASTWALMLTGRLLRAEPARDLRAALQRFALRSGEPVVRQAVTAAMRILARQFVMGRTIEEALDRARAPEREGYRHSYDMLGEAAHTAADAARYFAAYEHAVAAIGQAAAGRAVEAAPGISVKLSALHPRYEMAQRERVLAEMTPRLLALARQAREAGIGFTIDAEEADRLDLSLDLIEALALAPELAGWDGLGLAVQAYQKRALPLIDWLADLARRGRRRLMVRLVKGAYWDSEIKKSQERGLDGYPVYTRKVATDVSYLAAAHRLLDAGDVFYPQFATHNAHTVAAILELAGDRRDWEFQRLHGMGEALYDEIVGPEHFDRPCRIYAPVGSHEELLAYLVRRLLENGANTSFVNRIVDDKQPIDDIIADPIAQLARLPVKPHPRIPLPRDLYMPGRKNSRGIDLADPRELIALRDGLVQAMRQPWHAAPIIGGVEQPGEAKPAFDPSDQRRQIGTVIEAGPEQLDRALDRAADAASAWDRRPAEERAAILERAADLFEANGSDLLARVIREGGRTIPAAVAELREAVDYLRYYAMRARADFATPEPMPGPTGERNEVALHGRGVFACIAPWNFPLAIFTGQIAAALAAGNAVIAKPAEQTAAHRRRRSASIARGRHSRATCCICCPAPGRGSGRRSSPTPGSPVSRLPARPRPRVRLRSHWLRRPGPLVPLIAETGGQNAMIVDSSALPEQVVTDVLTSAFESAGQRCSSARLLYVQADIADRVIEMLVGAMAELTIGDPALLATDVGPVIDADARDALEKHAARMEREAPPALPMPTAFRHRARHLFCAARL